jgi:hypothetical protein
MMYHAMSYVGGTVKGNCIACGGAWVKNPEMIIYNRVPAWISHRGEYQSPICTGTRVHDESCNCKVCEK